MVKTLSHPEPTIRNLDQRRLTLRNIKRRRREVKAALIINMEKSVGDRDGEVLRGMVTYLKELRLEIVAMEKSILEEKDLQSEFELFTI
jgi:hypothetical protein